MTTDSRIDAVERPTKTQVVSRTALAMRVLLGSLMGLTWGASLRAWMVVLALKFGNTPQFSWMGTFGAILLPAALVGAMLGWAVYEAATSGRKRWRWAIVSPLVLAAIPAIVIKDFISDLIETGLGGGAIGVALIGMLGGYGFSGIGPKWLRWVSGFLGIVFAIAFGIGLFWVDGSEFGMPDASELYGALLFVLLMGALIVGVSAPARQRAQ